MIIDAILKINPNAKVVVKEEDYNKIEWLEGTTPISKEDIEAMMPEADQDIADKITKFATDKASAKAKLIAGEALTEDEANTIVL